MDGEDVGDWQSAGDFARKGVICLGRAPWAASDSFGYSGRGATSIYRTCAKSSPQRCWSQRTVLGLKGSTPSPPSILQIAIECLSTATARAI